MYGRQGIPYQVYIPPVDYDNNVKELKSPRRKLPRQYSDPPPYHENGTYDSDGSHYMDNLGVKRFDMPSQSVGTITSTKSSNCTYDSLQDERIHSYFSCSDYVSRGGVKPFTKKGRSHRYVIIVAVVLVALAILAATAATALKVTVFRDEGVIAESQKCMLANCSINGNWGEWDPWTDCSESCGNGTRTRNRHCDNPPPAFGGNNCVGFNTEEEACVLKHCPINGNWSDWENWSGCSTTCGGGIRNRTRNCDNPTPQHNGQDCVGVNSETSSCGEETCPPPGIWGTWLEWSDCSKTCDEGVSTRTRPCDNSAGGECIGTDTETKTCQDLICWGPWGEWSGCSLTCGNGLRSRNRTCDGKDTGEKCGWHPPTFKDTKTCTNSMTCQPGFCESRSANCSYNHPTRCDMYITCDAGKNMFEHVCNVLLWYKLSDTNPCLGHCDWEANVQCTL